MMQRALVLLLLAAGSPLVFGGLAGSTPRLPASPELRLVGESRTGEASVLPFASLPVADPRTLGLHIVRPEGFPRGTRPLDGVAATLELVNGDLLTGVIRGGDGDLMSLEVRPGVLLTLSIEELRSMTVPDYLPDRLDEPLVGPDEGDRLFRRTGTSLDRIDGTVEEFTAEGVRFDSVLGSKVFAWDELAALFVEVFEEARPNADDGGVPILVDLVEGSRLRGDLTALEVQGVRMRVSAQPEPVLLAWEHVEELLVDDGALAYLSSLETAGAVGNGTPFDDDLGLSFPHRVDRSVVGGALSSAGHRYARGVGMHAPYVLRWRLDPRWDELRGAVAIDDSAQRNASGAEGSVVFRVRLDGELLWESPVVRGGEGPRALPVLPLATDGDHVLELEVDPVDDFRGDRANWLRLLLHDRP